jgi:hypothetical protein
MKSLKNVKSIGTEIVQVNIGGQRFRLVAEEGTAVAPTQPVKNPVYQNRAERAWIKIYTDKAKAALKSGRTKIGAHYATKANEQASRLGQPLPFVKVEAVKPAPTPVVSAKVETLDVLEAIKRDIAKLKASIPSAQPKPAPLKAVAHASKRLSRKERKAVRKAIRHGRKAA